jgi:hypothetical protein
MKIFLSAVSAQLKACRDALASDLRAVGAEVVVQEDFTQLGGTLIEKLEAYIASCDRVIVLLGNALGFGPHPDARPPGEPPRSYSQWEYFFAQGERLDGKHEPAKPTFVYVASPEFLGSHPVEQSVEAADLQARFVAELKKSGQERSPFSSLHELRASVLRDGFRMGGAGQAAAARVKEIEAVYDLSLPAEGRTRITARLRSRLDPLLGDHALFGGRQNELGEIDRHLLDHPGGYLFVTGRPGFGKTALLANWIRGRQGSAEATCYHFLTRRYDKLATESFCFLNLCQQLGSAHGLRGALPTDPNELRSLYANLLQLPPANGGKLVVVLDGLDEALGWSPGADMFPAALPAGVFVIFSAGSTGRELPFSKLGFVRGQLETMEVGRFDAKRVGDLLAAIPELSGLAQDEAFVANLLQVSGGDPFYLHFLVEDLQKPGVDPRASLEKQPRGLQQYFYSRWKDLIDSGVDAHLDDTLLNDMLGYFAVANGPLRRSELIEMSPTAPLNAITVERTLESLARFAPGNEANGYSLGHHRFKDYVKGRLSPDQVEVCRKRLVEYCGRWREHSSRYALDHYALHLREEERYDQLFALVRDNEWLAARRASDLVYEGYLGDVALAWRTAEELDAAAIAEGRPPEQIAREVWCALTSGSIQTYRQRFDARLVAGLRRARLLTADQALAVALSRAEEHERVDALVDLCPLLDPEEIDQVFAILRGSTSDHGKMALVLALESVRPEQGQPERVAVLEAARTIHEGALRAKALFKLAPLLDADARGEAIDGARAAAKEGISLWRLFGEALVHCAKKVEDPRIGAIVEELHGLAAGVNELDGHLFTACVFEVLPVDRQREWLAGLGEHATSPDLELAALHCLHEEERARKADILLDAVGNSQNSRVKADILERLAPHLRADQLIRAGAVAAAIAEPGHRFKALCALFERDPDKLTDQLATLLKTAGELPGDAAALARVSVFVETPADVLLRFMALERLRYLGGVEAWTRALVAYQADLPDDIRRDLGLVIYRAGLSAGDPAIVTRGLVAFAPLGRRNIVEIVALKVALKLIDALQAMQERQKMERLDDESPALLASRLGATLDAIMETTATTLSVLQSLAALLPLVGDWAEKLADLVFPLVLEIRLPFNQAQAIGMFVPLLPRETLSRFTSLVEEEQWDAGSKAELIRGLAQRLPELDSEALLRGAARLGSPVAEVEALCALAVELPIERAVSCLTDAITRLDGLSNAPAPEAKPSFTDAKFFERASIQVTFGDRGGPTGDPRAVCCVALLHAVVRLGRAAVGELLPLILQRAEEVAKTCADPADRTRLYALRSLVSEGEARKRDAARAFQVAEGIANPVARAKILSPVAESLGAPLRRRAATSLFRALAARGRPEVLSGLTELAPVLRGLGGAAACAAVPAMIQANVLNWPCVRGPVAEAFGDPQKQTLAIDGDDLPLIPPDDAGVELGLAVLRLIALELRRHRAEWIDQREVAVALTEGHAYVLAPAGRRPMRSGWTREASLSILSSCLTLRELGAGKVDLSAPSKEIQFLWGGDRDVMRKIGDILASSEDSTAKALGRGFLQVVGLSAEPLPSPTP